MEKKKPLRSRLTKKKKKLKKANAVLKATKITMTKAKATTKILDPPLTAKTAFLS
jgi:hypothetical protein